MIYSPRRLTPIYLKMAEQISAALPTAVAERLVWSRNAFRHGSKTDMILFNAWDRQQTGLERNQFNYCLNYKPLRPESGNHIWLLQVRCNIQRIAVVYPDVRDALRLKLRRLRKVCPKPFCYREDDQTVELRYTFNFDKPLSALPKILGPRLKKLITVAHPILVSAIDLFHRDAPLSSKPDVGIVPRRKRTVRKDLVIYSSHLTAEMELQVLERYGHRCARCNRPVQRGDLEFHHLRFKSRGGLRLVENFAPLHISCHDELHRVAGKDGPVPAGFLRSPRTTMSRSAPSRNV